LSLILLRQQTFFGLSSCVVPSWAWWAIPCRRKQRDWVRASERSERECMRTSMYAYKKWVYNPLIRTCTHRYTYPSIFTYTYLHAFGGFFNKKFPPPWGKRVYTRDDNQRVSLADSNTHPTLVKLCSVCVVTSTHTHTHTHTHTRI
jgi:hypothetical protein